MASETLKIIEPVLGCCVNEWCPLKWERADFYKSFETLAIVGGRYWIRTSDPLIKSQLLYLLS